MEYGIQNKFVANQITIKAWSRHGESRWHLFTNPCFQNTFLMIFRNFKIKIYIYIYFICINIVAFRNCWPIVFIFGTNTGFCNRLKNLTGQEFIKYTCPFGKDFSQNLAFGSPGVFWEKCYFSSLIVLKHIFAEILRKNCAQRFSWQVHTVVQLMGYYRN